MAAEATTTSIRKLVALVTGGASGLGKATVQRLVAKGYKVGLLDLPLSDGEQLADQLGKDNVHFLPVDVSSDELVKQAVASVHKNFGEEGVHVCVNCAGIAYAHKLYRPKDGLFMEQEQIEQTIKVNLLGTINVVKHCLPYFIKNEPDENKQRGLIINTSSIAAYDGQDGQVIYAATKGAISSMTLPLAREWSHRGIRAMTIAPGLFDTPLVQSLPPKARDFLKRTVPFPQQLGQPEQFAALVEHIIDNPYLNGEVIRLDGALRMGA